MTHPFVLNLAPTGMIPTREMTPHAPLSTREIVNDVDACATLGLSAVHLHVRDEQGLPSNDPERYARLIGAIRERHEELVICVSCSGRQNPEFEARAAVLELEDDLRPDMRNNFV